MRRTIFITTLVIFTFFLAACQPASVPTANSSPTQSERTTNPSPTAPDSSSSVKATEPAKAGQSLVRNDNQGNVEVSITPENLSDSGDTLVFDVGMNTHSVDLSMDLSTLSTLATDTGLTVNAQSWDAPGSGHHVSGKLIFPALVDGKPLLQGAKTLTLTIKNVDAPERVFTWELTQ